MDVVWFWLTTDFSKYCCFTDWWESRSISGEAVEYLCCCCSFEGVRSEGDDVDSIGEEL